MPDVMSQKTLRDLAREYARGELSKEAYRQSRSTLITGIQAGTIALPAIEYRPLIQPPDKYAEVAERRGKKGRGPDESDATAIAIPGKPVVHALPEPDFDLDVMMLESESPERAKFVAMIVIGVVLLAAVAGYVYLQKGAPERTAAQDSTAAEVETKE